MCRYNWIFFSKRIFNVVFCLGWYMLRADRYIYICESSSAQQISAHINPTKPNELRFTLPTNKITQRAGPIIARAFCIFSNQRPA